MTSARTWTLMLAGAVLIGFGLWVFGPAAVRSRLYLCALDAELFGIYSVASPEIDPQVARLATWLLGAIVTGRRRVKRIIDRVLRRPPQVITGVGAATLGRLSGRAVGFVSPNQNASDREFIDYLMTQVREAQEHLIRIDDRLENMRTEVSEEIARADESIRALLERRLLGVTTNRLWRRLAGVGLLAFGAVIGTIANVLPPPI